ncbi:MAG: 2-hydroxyacyl-CoA dehydratase [Candidatus Zixiibacteriota bacterium]|nr:MAG: 2-hydroxyacyl-CoA dehydratase [candidate division Zixibacteria bacterium]
MARLQAQTRLKELMREYYTGLKSPLAWCTSAGPAEVLRALGFDVYFPENHGALLGASRAAQKYIPKAHQIGYAPEICSYLTADIGAYLAGETPLTAAYGLEELPKPDLIVYNTNQCREVADWFGFFAREFRCPIVGITPPRHLEEITSADIDAVVAQFQTLISKGEEVIGAPLDQDRLVATVRLSKEGSDLWKQVLETARQAPAPLTFWDGTILMAPIVMLRGTSACVDFYRDALAELRELNARGEAAVPDEEVRIYWEGMPIWGRLRMLSEFFAENHAAVVASTYCNSWIFDDFDPGDPLPSLASAYTRIFINRGEETKLRLLKDIAAAYRVDGIVFHDAKTCFNNSNCRFGMPKRFERETGIPTLTLDGDLNDMRFFSDGQARTRLETFLEQVKGSVRA